MLACNGTMAKGTGWWNSPMDGSSGILTALSTSNMHPWCASYCKFSQLVVTPYKTPRYEPPMGPALLMFSQWSDDGGQREVAMLQNNQATYYRTVGNHVLLNHHLCIFMCVFLFGLAPGAFDLVLLWHDFCFHG
jgi:hypothetical protein